MHLEPPLIKIFFPEEARAHKLFVVRHKTESNIDRVNVQTEKCAPSHSSVALAASLSGVAATLLMFLI